MFDLKDLMSKVNLPHDITRRGFLEVASVTATLAAMNQVRAQTGTRPYIILQAPEGLIVGDPLSVLIASAVKWPVPNITTAKTTPF